MIYLITRIDFDPMMNLVKYAQETTILGYTRTREEAEQYVEIDKQANPPKKQWDGEEYPQYKIETAKLICVSTLKRK